jgi:hypothetical protein
MCGAKPFKLANEHREVRREAFQAGTSIEYQTKSRGGH